MEDEIYKRRVEEIIEQYFPEICNTLEEECRRRGYDPEKLYLCEWRMRDERIYSEDILGHPGAQYKMEINKIYVYWENIQEEYPEINERFIVECIAHEYRHCFQRMHFGDEFMIEQQRLPYHERATEQDAESFANLMGLMLL